MIKNMDYIFFVYGFSFILLAVVCFIISKQERKPKLPWNWLAIFGILHGINEWLDMLVLALPDHFWFKGLRLAIMGGSFLALFEFGRRGLAEGRPGLAGVWLYLPLSVLGIACGFFGSNGLNAGLRYTFGLLGGILAALAFLRQAKKSESVLGRRFRFAAISIFLYVLSAGFVVPRSPFFPASVINHDSFFLFTGVPVQAVRGLLAFLIAFFIWVSFIQILKHDSAKPVKRIETVTSWPVIALIVVLASGWVFVNEITARIETYKRKYFLETARAFSKNINIENLLALSGTKADLTLPQYGRIWSCLLEIPKIYPCRFAHLLGIRNDKITFLVDSEPAGSPDRSLPGDVYEEAPPDFRNVFENESSYLIGPYTDRWGKWVSVTLPIVDPNSGHILAAFCMDIDALSWANEIAYSRLVAISIILFMAIVVLAGFIIFMRVGTQSKLFLYAETLYIGVTCLLLTLGVFVFSFVNARYERRDKFQQVADSYARVFQDEMVDVRVDLNALTKLFRDSDGVDRREFHDYAVSLVRGHIGRQAFAWIPRVSADELPRYEAQARQDGIADFMIFEKSSTGQKVAVSGRPEYFPLYYLESRSDNKAALGFDAGSEPLWRKALEAARKSGLRQATETITFVVNQEGRKYGILVYQPLYRVDADLSSEENRSQALIGWLMAVIRPQSLLETGLLGVFHGERQLGEIAVLDMDDAHGINLLASFPEIKDINKGALGSLLKKNPGDLKEITATYFFGHNYAIICTPNKYFSAVYPMHMPWVVLFGGFIFTGILTVLVYVLQSGRKRAEEIVEQRTAELRETTRYLQDLIAYANAPIIVWDPQFRINQFNHAFESLTGRKAGDVIGKPIDLLFPPATAENTMKFIQNTLTGERWEVVEINIQHIDGSVRIVLWNSATIFAPDGKTAVAIIAQGQDITERKQAEENIKQKQLELEKTNARLLKDDITIRNAFEELRKSHNNLMAAEKKLVQSEKLAAIGQLAAGVAHEINNPLGFVTSNLSTLDKYMSGLSEALRASEALRQALKSNDLEKAAEVERQILEIEARLDIKYILSDLDNLLKESREGLERIRRTVLDLKNFSRKDEDEKSPMDLNMLLDTIINIVWSEIKYKAELKKEYGQLPQVFCNGQQIGQVFMNLLMNASQAIEGKGLITLRTYWDKKNVYVEVSDTGKGIPEEIIDKIYEPFFTTKKIGEGTGLGLSISYDIVRAHQGSITVESQVGKGSKFTVILPVHGTL